MVAAMGLIKRPHRQGSASPNPVAIDNSFQFKPSLGRHAPVSVSLEALVHRGRLWGAVILDQHSTGKFAVNL